jgi:hypothetical protein
MAKMPARVLCLFFPALSFTMGYGILHKKPGIKMSEKEMTLSQLAFIVTEDCNFSCSYCRQKKIGKIPPWVCTLNRIRRKEREEFPREIAGKR